MSKLVIRKTLKGISVVQDGAETPFHRPGHTASAEILLSIFDELQVDGVAVIERPKAARTHIQSADYVEGVSGWRIDTADGSIKLLKKNVSISAKYGSAVFTVADPLESQNAEAAESVSRAEDRTRKIEYPFIVEADKLKINGIEIGDAGKILDYLRSQISVADLAQGVEAKIGEAIAPQQVTNICSQVNNYGDQPFPESALLEIIRREIKNAARHGGPQ